MCVLCSVPGTEEKNWIFLPISSRSVSFNVLSLFYASCICIVCKRRTQPDEGDGERKKSNQYSASKATWLSFFRPCTCALILLLIWSLYTTINTLHACGRMQDECDRFSFYHFSWIGNTTLASNVIAVIGFVSSLSIVTTKVRSATITMQAPRRPQPSPTINRRKQQAPKSFFVAIENLFTFTLNLGWSTNSRIQFTTPIHSFLIAFSMRDSVQCRHHHHKWPKCICVVCSGVFENDGNGRI